MIRATPVIAPYDLTKKQLVQAIDEQLGGWPITAAAVHMFESSNPQETVYRFVDDNGISLEDNQYRTLTPPLWNPHLTRDEYFLYHLSPEAKAIIAEHVKVGIIADILESRR